MFNDVIWFAGFIILHLVKNQINNVSSEELNCTVTENQLYADCSERKLKSIKRGLGEKLEILNISSNLFDELKDDDLKEYIHLKELIMKFLNVFRVQVNFLMPLVELNILDISSSNLENPPKFPPSITTLMANDIRLGHDALKTKYDFTNLEKLEEIHINHGDLHTLPALNIKAPIINLYACKNPIKKLELDYLAHFCQLKHLGLDRFAKGHEAADNCCYVKLWVDEYHIISELECEKECAKDKYPFSKSAVDTYNECLENIPPEESFWETYNVIIEIAVGCVLSIAIIFLVVRYFRSSAVKAHKRDQKLLKEENAKLAESAEPMEAAESIEIKEEASVAEEESNEEQ